MICKTFEKGHDTFDELKLIFQLRVQVAFIIWEGKGAKKTLSPRIFLKIRLNQI